MAPLDYGVPITPGLEALCRLGCSTVDADQVKVGTQKDLKPHFVQLRMAVYETASEGGPVSGG